MTDPAATLVQHYLEAEQNADLRMLASLFAAHPTIRNAAAPEASGETALQAFAESFWERTERRAFTLIDAASSDDGHSIHAVATASIRFGVGVAFGPHVTAAPIDVEMVVGLWFHLDEQGDVDVLEVHHETSTAPRLAAATRVG